MCCLKSRDIDNILSLLTQNCFRMAVFDWMLSEEQREVDRGIKMTYWREHLYMSTMRLTVWSIIFRRKAKRVYCTQLKKPRASKHSVSLLKGSTRKRERDVSRSWFALWDAVMRSMALIWCWNEYFWPSSHMTMLLCDIRNTDVYNFRVFIMLQQSHRHIVSSIMMHSHSEIAYPLFPSGKIVEIARDWCRFVGYSFMMKKTPIWGRGGWGLAKVINESLRPVDIPWFGCLLFAVFFWNINNSHCVWIWLPLARGCKSFNKNRYSRWLWCYFCSLLNLAKCSCALHWNHNDKGTCA